MTGGHDSKKFARLANFDDEINIAIVKKLLQTIKDEVEGNLFTYDKFDIEEYTKYYVNDFSFDKPKVIKYDVWEEMIERLNKTYFRFDYDKSERPSSAEDKKLIEQLICTQGKNLKKDQYVYGICDDKIKYDIVTEDYNIKIFDFDGKNLNLLINNVRRRIEIGVNCILNSRLLPTRLCSHTDNCTVQEGKLQLLVALF